MVNLFSNNCRTVCPFRTYNIKNNLVQTKTYKQIIHFTFITVEFFKIIKNFGNKPVLKFIAESIFYLLISGAKVND